MPLRARINGNYNPASPNITNKYQPLRAVQVATPGDDVAVQNMATNRIDTLNYVGVQVNSLTYISKNTIANYAVLEAGRNPPLVIVSSNRASWIAAGYQRAMTILGTLGVGNFTSVNDVRALQNGPVPFYLPVRMSAAESANTSVYMFVASEEYKYYRDELLDTGITVIGWRSDGYEALAGFGASRYAAMEFFKCINRQAGNPCPNIWMLDDNVCYIQGFPGFAGVNAQMTGGLLGNKIGLGFRGGDVVADAVLTALSVAGAPAAVAANAYVQALFLQQAVVWNVARFNTPPIAPVNPFTFSPYFITSAEDTSLANFLRANYTLNSCMYYAGCTILKGITTYDNSDGYLAVLRSKGDLINYCYGLKNDVPYATDMTPPNPPPTTLDGVATAGRLGTTAPPMLPVVAGSETIGQTYSKAVEQTLSLSVRAGVPPPANVFTPAIPHITSKLSIY